MKATKMSAPNSSSEVDRRQFLTGVAVAGTTAAVLLEPEAANAATDSSSYEEVLVERGYYYEPFKDDGPLATQFQQIGQTAGSALGGYYGKPFGPLGAVGGALIGKSAGGMAGYTAGFYGDNISTIEQHVETFMSELNDYMDAPGFSLEDWGADDF
jgi:hypothetical protein